LSLSDIETAKRICDHRGVILRRPFELLLAAVPLLAVGSWFEQSRSWFTGALFGVLLALYLVAVGQWLAARRRV
jgi:hypothetical protein